MEYVNQDADSESCGESYADKRQILFYDFSPYEKLQTAVVFKLHLAFQI